MPYNVTPINPAAEVTGSCALPLMRVQRIIRADPDTGECSKNAAFAIAVATEMFVQYLAETIQQVVAAENSRGRTKRAIQYKHVAAAVAKVDNLEWLADVVPNTILFKDLQKQQRTKGESSKGVDGLTNGQQTLPWNPKANGDDPTDVEDEAMLADAGRDELEPAAAPSSAQARHTYDAVHSVHSPPQEQDVKMNGHGW